MIKIISQIFTELGFERQKFQDNSQTLFHRAIDNSKEEYFIVKEVTNLKVLLADGVLNEFEQFIDFANSSSGFDKNTSLLVIWKASSEEEIQQNQRLMYEIEEDPYNFKKYVLSYTDQELDTFIHEYQDTSLGNLTVNLSNPGMFQEFRLNFNTQSAYSLLTKIFIKIPILKLKVNHADYQSLAELISLPEREEELRKVIDNLDEEEINDISLQTLDSILNKLN